MSTSTLLTIIAIGTAAVLGVSIGGFIIFSRFLRREEEQGKRFREIHKVLPPDER